MRVGVGKARGLGGGGGSLGSLSLPFFFLENEIN